MSLKTSASTGSIYIIAYVIITAVSHVFINHTARSVSPTASLFYSSLFTILFFSILNIREITKNIALIKENKVAILWINIFNAVIWFIAFYSLQVLSPAVFACLFLGAIPINVFLIELKNSKSSRKERLTTASILFIMFLLMLSLVFQDVTETNLFQLLKYGAIVVFLGGFVAALIMNISKQLAIKNMPATLVVSLRFYGLLILSLIFSISHPSQLLLSTDVLIELVLLALVTMALPLYLLQKGLKTVSPWYASIVITFIPILTYFLQIATGYYSFSVVKLGISGLFSLSVIALAYSKKAS